MIALAIEMGVYDDDKDEENSNNDLEAAAANDLKAAAADQLVVTVAEQEDTAAESEHSSKLGTWSAGLASTEKWRMTESLYPATYPSKKPVSHIYFIYNITN